MRRLLLVLTIGLSCSFMQAMQPVKRMYVFGDSYSDIGRSIVYTNGPTAVAFFAKRLGLEMVPGNAKNGKGKSLNFAISGARSGETFTTPAPSRYVQLGVKDEVAEFAKMAHTGKVVFHPAATVFFLAGGLNDSELPTEVTVANLESEMQTLYDLGGRRFLLAVLPEKIPAFSGVAIRLNPALRKIPSAMRPKLAGAEIELSDWGTFFDEVMTHPARYGITNTTEPCAARPVPGEKDKPCASPDTHFYYYPNHPSRAAAKAVGDMMYDAMMGKATDVKPNAAP